jgi:hypothetical protein
MLSAAPTRSQILVTFDDFDLSHSHAYSTNIPNGYQGLNWTNFGVVNPVLMSNALTYSVGYGYGMISPSNVAYNAFGNPAEIDARGTNFDFLSAYLTAAWNSNLNIEVEGFRDTNLVYDQTKIVSPFGPTLFTFNYLDIDRLYFNSFGGEPAFGAGSEENFAMDNFMFEFIPEPSTFLLAALAAVSLAAFLGRKRA